MTNVIRVLVVDDSAVMRQQLRYILQSDAELQVVGEARNGEEAVALAKRLRPAVITMDLTMPKMGGLDAIRYIMAECPTPIVVVTNADFGRDADLAREATKLGAVSVLNAPGRISDGGFKRVAGQLVAQVKLMSDVRVIGRPLRGQGARRERDDGPHALPADSGQEVRIIAVGSSTGGPAALYHLLGTFPADLPVPILIVQHISFGFVEGLAGWLDGGCRLRVRVAGHGDRVRAGNVYLAPDEAHLAVDRFGRARLREDGPVGGHLPSVNVLFQAVAHAYGPAAVGVLMTGMGSDGATGMKALRDAGAMTIAQDESSCVVFGMPKEAIGLGAVIHILPLEKIARTVVSQCNAPQRRRGEGWRQ